MLRAAKGITANEMVHNSLADTRGSLLMYQEIYTLDTLPIDFLGGGGTKILLHRHASPLRAQFFRVYIQIYRNIAAAGVSVPLRPPMENLESATAIL